MNSGINLQEAAGRATLLEPAGFGRTLVVAPHPDDESLACGGTIALLQQAGPVYVVFVSDGSRSHPNSMQYSAPKLAALREQEAVRALEALQVPAEQAIFLRLQDAELPMPDGTGFQEAVETVIKLLAVVRPDTIILPWRRDPHPDHRASWQLFQAATLASALHPRMLEYPLWLWERGREQDLPQPEEVCFYQVDISIAVLQKQAAIMAHRSQVSNLIDDDPDGFQLSQEVLAHFGKPYEIFFGTI